jgi:hypothetical protein
MEKFLSIPVTNEQNQLVSCKDIKLIEQGSTTTVVITYGGGKIVTITHAAAPAGNEAQRDKIQAKVVESLGSAWYNVSLQVSDLPYAVSGIAIV